MSAETPGTVLHYTGYRDARGGIVAVIRGMRCRPAVHGVSGGYTAQKGDGLEAWYGPAIEGETISLGNLWCALRVARAVRDWLAQEPGRIFQGHSRAGLLVALWLHCGGERRLVVSVHCYGRQRWFYRLAAWILGPRLFWLTPAMKRYYYGGTDSDWNRCVPNSLPDRPTVRWHRWPGGRPLLLGGAGTLVRGKSWDLIIRTLAALPAGTQVEYFHAGGPLEEPESLSYADELERLAEDLGVAARVHWLGWLPDTTALWSKIDLLVVPAVRESFSMSALEALWAGVPVLGVRGGGPEDLILPGVNGWLVDREDPTLLAEQIVRCLDPRQWPEQRRDEAHLARFQAMAVAEQWRKIYASL